MSPKHMARYARGFAGKNNCRGMDTLGRVRYVAAALVGRRPDLSGADRPERPQLSGPRARGPVTPFRPADCKWGYSGG